MFIWNNKEINTHPEQTLKNSKDIETILIEGIALDAFGIKVQSQGYLDTSFDQFDWQYNRANGNVPSDLAALTPPTGGWESGDAFLSPTRPDGVNDMWIWTSQAASGFVGFLGPIQFQGATGAASYIPGPPNTLTVGTVQTGAAGSNVSVLITGTSPNQVISFIIPRGDTGATGANGTQGIPGTNGTNGPQGIQGFTPYVGANTNWWINGVDTGYPSINPNVQGVPAGGTAGQVLTKNTSTDFDTSWVTPSGGGGGGSGGFPIFTCTGAANSGIWTPTVDQNGNAFNPGIVSTGNKFGIIVPSNFNISTTTGVNLQLVNVSTGWNWTVYSNTLMAANALGAAVQVTNTSINTTAGALVNVEPNQVLWCVVKQQYNSPNICLDFGNTWAALNNNIFAQRQMSYINSRSIGTNINTTWVWDNTVQKYKTQFTISGNWEQVLTFFYKGSDLSMFPSYWQSLYSITPSPSGGIPFKMDYICMQGQVMIFSDYPFGSQPNQTWAIVSLS